MKDFWPGDGCGFGQFTRHTKDKRARARRRLLREHADKRHLPGDVPVWPFVHNVIRVEGIQQALDPLAVPLVKKLGEMKGLTLVGSCQGHADGSPYFNFHCPDHAAMDVVKMVGLWKHDQRLNMWYWDVPILTLEGQREGEPSWLLQFYDPFALMRFTAEALGVPLNVQMHGIPEGVEHKENFEVIADISAFEAVVMGRRRRA